MLNRLSQTVLLAGALSACAEPTPKMQELRGALIKHRAGAMKICKAMTREEIEKPTQNTLEEMTEEREKMIENIDCEDASYWICTPGPHDMGVPNFYTQLNCDRIIWHLDADGVYVAQ